MKKPEPPNRSALRIAATLFATAALACPPMLAAQEIYKSVDADGKVTYSSVPPAEAVDTKPVTVPDAPSEAQVKEAVQREQQFQREADRMKQQQAQSLSQRERQVGNAEKTENRAKSRLEKAKEIRDSDWQGKAGGGRRLKQSYFDRVQKAEEALGQAEKEAANTRRDTR